MQGYILATFYNSKGKVIYEVNGVKYMNSRGLLEVWVRTATMKVKMRYLSHDVAKHFGSRKKREIVCLSDNAMYEHLLDLLKKKYERAIKQLYGRKLREKMFDTFIFICDGKPLRTIRDKMINPDGEVLVAYADFGG